MLVGASPGEHAVEDDPDAFGVERAVAPQEFADRLLVEDPWVQTLGQEVRDGTVGLLSACDGLIGVAQRHERRIAKLDGGENLAPPEE